MGSSALLWTSQTMNTSQISIVYLQDFSTGLLQNSTHLLAKIITIISGVFQACLGHGARRVTADNTDVWRRGWTRWAVPRGRTAGLTLHTLSGFGSFSANRLSQRCAGHLKSLAETQSYSLLNRIRGLICLRGSKEKHQFNLLQHAKVLLEGKIFV